MIEDDKVVIIRLANDVIEKLPRGRGYLADEMQRAALSIVLNIAEGCGRFARPEKAHFYLIARGSAMECAGAFDVALSRGLVSVAAYRHGRGMLVRVVQMLTRLARRMQQAP